MKNKHIQSHDQFAKNYDNQTKQYHSYGHDIIFGMSYEYIQPRETLLDLGIGTGLSSINFAKAGLDVVGLDGSSEMLKECKRKKFSKELHQYNIQETPLPFSDNQFSHCVCCGVFHFFNDLDFIFNEVKRLVNSEGIFTFTVASCSVHEASSSETKYIEAPSAWGISFYKHSNSYISYLAKRYGFTIEKEQKILVDSGDPQKEDLLFKVFIFKKIYSL